MMIFSAAPVVGVSSDSAGIGGHGFASHCRAISKSWLQATRVPMAGAILARVLPLAAHDTGGDLLLELKE
jgi:hypothetical protein